MLVISIVCVNNRFISCVIVLLYSAIPLIWPSHVTKLTLFYPRNFSELSKLKRMERRLRIHIGKLPSSLFVGVPVPLEVFLIDEHDCVYSGYFNSMNLNSRSVGDYFLSLLYENRTPVSTTNAIFVCDILGN